MFADGFVQNAAIALLPFAAIYHLYRRQKRRDGYRAGEVGAAMLFLSPWVIGFLGLAVMAFGGLQNFAPPMPEPGAIPSTRKKR